MSYDVRHMPPLTMRLEPLRMRRITWPVRRGQSFPKYLKCLTLICLFTMQPPRLYNPICLFTSPQNGGFWSKKGCKALTFGFATAKRHILVRNRVFWHILRQNPYGRLGCR